MILALVEAVRNISTVTVKTRIKENIMQIEQMKNELPRISAGLWEVGESL